jgi:anti-sigma B factor antagonist
MTVDIKEQNNVVIVSITGSIDSKTAGEFQKQILEGTADTSKVIMDLSKVDFVSSAGLRILLMVYRQIKSKDGKVILVGVSEEIQDVMSITGFINFFEISESVDNGMKLF